MLTQLTTLKSRLAITDTQSDALLTSAIQAVGARFDKETRRGLARATDLPEEFAADETEVCLSCYPVESVTRFELKTNETDGWVEQAGVEFLLRSHCVLSLSAPLGSDQQLARVTYTGGYVLPGTAPGDGQTALPADLEQAAIEQVVFWYNNRDRVGVIREWPKGGVYLQFAGIDLIPSVQSVLANYRRVAW